MSDELIKVKESLKLEKKELVDRLQKIEDDLKSIDRVLGLLGKNKKPIKRIRKEGFFKKEHEEITGRFTGLSFKESIEIIFNENKDKKLRPIDVTKELLKGGFKTKSKNFNNTVRTLLGNFRQDGIIDAEKKKGGWLYSAKKDPISILD